MTPGVHNEVSKPLTVPNLVIYPKEPDSISCVASPRVDKQVDESEEFANAMRFYRFLTERGARVTMKQIDAPKTEWASAHDVFADAYHHETIVTERIYKIGDIADRLGDRSAQSMLTWFYNEQTEEEARASFDGTGREVVQRWPTTQLIL